MTDAPETIWARTTGSSDKCFVSFTTPSEDYNVQYTRTDIAQKPGWQPIETAESGESYLVYAHGYVLTATKMGTHWMNKGEEIFPTYIMPLPAAPALVTQGVE